MLQYMRFCPLLNENGAEDSPWPAHDPYARFGAEKFANDGPIIWFEPLPPMMADLERQPKLPPMQPAFADTFTLVLDLDETLVHYFEQNGLGAYGIRPGMREFLQRMNQAGYEMVIFTAATQDYADWVIDQIDPDNLVHHRLYRQHALPWGPLFAKDLRGLGRNLDRTLIIDNVQENFMLQPNNGIFISTWYDDPEDTALFELTPLLEELISTRVTVPEILNKYRDQIPAWAGFGRYWEDSGSEVQQPLEVPPPQPPQRPATAPAPMPSTNPPLGQQGHPMELLGHGAGQQPQHDAARVLSAAAPYTQMGVHQQHQQQHQQ
jgi:Dullard-like phosphatase family protein